MQTERDHHHGPLLELAKTGNEFAIDQLAEIYWADAYRIAVRIVRSHEDAEEIAQDSLWAAIKHLPRFRQDASFRTWLHRIVVNHSLMALRRKRSRGVDSTVPLTLEPASNCTEASRTPEEVVLDGEWREVIEEAIARLPAPYATVLRLAAHEELSMRDIAMRVGLSTGAVKTRLHRGRQELRRAISHRLHVRTPWQASPAELQCSVAA